MLFGDYWVYFLQIPYYLRTVTMPTTRLNLKMSGWIFTVHPIVLPIFRQGLTLFC